MTDGPDVFSGVAGQPDLVAQLRAAAVRPVHAYLLVGPPGAGTGAAAQAFAAALLCPEGGCGRCRDCRLVLAGEHADVVTFVPEGAFLRVSDAEEIARVAMRSPVEGQRKVLVLTDFHRVQKVGPALLKTIEEPPPSTVFVVLADTVPPELVTIASRCVRVDVAPLAEATLVEVLIAEGVDPAAAAAAAAAAGGSIERARLLASDADLAARRTAWWRVPERLDGSGAAVAVVVAELVELLDAAAEPVRRAQAEVLAELDPDAATPGGRSSAPPSPSNPPRRAGLEAAHKRALRRHRADELRFGLATLGARYRAAVAGTAVEGGRLRPLVAALDAIVASAGALSRNPNEALLLQALFLELPALPPDPGTNLGDPPARVAQTVERRSRKA